MPNPTPDILRNNETAGTIFRESYRVFQLGALYKIINHNKAKTTRGANPQH